MAGTTASVIGAGAAIKGAFDSKSAQDDAARDGRRAFQLTRQQLANAQLQPGFFNTSLGGSAGFNFIPGTNQLEGFSEPGTLGLLGGDLIDRISAGEFDATLPSNFLPAAQTADAQLQSLQGNPFASFDFANQLRTSGFQRGLQDQFGGAAARSLATAGLDPSVLGQQRLDILRQQAAPFEQRAFNNLQTNLFNTGRLGTTGGGLQTEAFARGLGQADLGRQLAAQDFGFQQQNAAAARAGQFTNQLQGLRGFEDALLGSTFDRALTLDSAQSQRALQRFGLAQSIFNATNQASGLNIDRRLQGLNTGVTLSNLESQNFQNALNLALARSNVGLGVGTGLASVTPTAGSQISTGGDILQQLGVGIFQGAGGAGNFGIKT